MIEDLLYCLSVIIGRTLEVIYKTSATNVSQLLIHFVNDIQMVINENRVVDAYEIAICRQLQASVQEFHEKNEFGAFIFIVREIFKCYLENKPLKIMDYVAPKFESRAGNIKRLLDEYRSQVDYSLSPLRTIDDLS